MVGGLIVTHGRLAIPPNMSVRIRTPSGVWTRSSACEPCDIVVPTHRNGNLFQDTEATRLLVLLISFGFKYGVPSAISRRPGSLLPALKDFWII
jgi:hypothetical protein